MGLLKAIANAGFKATEKVVGGTAKVAGKAIGGTAKFVGKTTGKVATRAVGKAVLKKTGVMAPVGGFNSRFENFVGHTTINAVAGGLKFVNRHKKGVIIAGASLKAADSISHMIYKRNEEDDDFDEEDSYKISIRDYLDSSKKQVLFRIC